jgi:hypothetical protein
MMMALHRDHETDDKFRLLPSPVRGASHRQIKDLGKINAPNFESLQSHRMHPKIGNLASMFGNEAAQSLSR